MGGYTTGGYTLPSRDHAINTSETLQPQETYLGEEDDDEDYAANNGETLCESAFFVTLRPKDPGPE